MTCIDCGREFTRGIEYHGNYCPECRQEYTRE